MHKILVAYDDSDEAKKALNHAKKMLDQEDELILAMVLPPLEDKAFAKVEADIKYNEARTLLKGVIDELRKEGFSAKYVLKTGEVANSILEIGNENQCKLIVIGYKGVSKIGRFSLGSVVDKVSRYADRPVLIIK